MKILICGAGQVGWNIARHLVLEHELTVIDTSPTLVQHATQTLSVSGIVGSASHPDVLKSANAYEADKMIAVTSSDEVNIVACSLAKRIFGVQSCFARVRAGCYLNKEHLRSPEDIWIDVVISPEREVARATLKQILMPATFDTEAFFDGALKMVGIRIDPHCALANTPLGQLTEMFPEFGANVAALRRISEQTREETLFPTAKTDHMLSMDHAYVFCADYETSRVLKIFGKLNQPLRKIILVGGGNIGLLVASEIEKQQGVRLKVVERSQKQAEAAAVALERTVVLHGDGLDREILEEAGIRDADAVVALTDDDKANLVIAARAKSLGCRYAISLINDPFLASLVDQMGIDAYVNPRARTVSSILKHIRDKNIGDQNIGAIYTLGDADAEIIQARIRGDSDLAGKTIRESGFAKTKGIRVAGLRKEGKMVRLSLDSRLEEGDEVVLFVMAEDFARVDELLRASSELF